VFTEFKCRCISSAAQGFVRLCEIHHKDRDAEIPHNKVVRRYPANGMMVLAWNGGK
jgi:hypothetical protein